MIISFYKSQQIYYNCIEVYKMNKTFIKVVTIILLIAMIGTSVAAILSYFM